MKAYDQIPQLVEKELIPTLSFKDIIISDRNPELEHQIEQAVRLGNAYHSKVSIVFMDDIGLKRVETTIWAKGEKFICLKGGIWLPIARIISINF
ncbi:MAG: hypothetical protein M9916_08620 [Crocinitomicaceae bacterium]|nr:hypothetical protein [Crocinitomicaceae bacterium]